MPKRIAARLAFKAGAKYDDDKTSVRPEAPETVKAKAEAVRPKFIPARLAFQVGAKYDDSKTRVSPFPSKPVDPEAMKARAEVDARAALVQSVDELKKAVATQEQALADIQKVAQEELKPELPSHMSFDHQRDASGAITKTVVSGDQDFVLDHIRGPDGRITKTIFTKREGQDKSWQ